MISNFPISENENPNLALFRKLKEQGILTSLQNNIQNDFKDQHFIPQNEFTRANLPKILKITQNFKKQYLEPNAFKYIPKFLEPTYYKSLGKLKFSSDSKLVYKMKYEKEDKKFQQTHLKIINKLIQKKKGNNKSTMKIFYEKLILWLAKTKSTSLVQPSQVVTLLKSLQNEDFGPINDNIMAIDEDLLKSQEDDNNNEVDFESEEQHFTGILYPKFENIIEFFDISPPDKNVIIRKGFNLIVRENDPFQNHIDDTLACSFWKIKEIKRFFILYLKNFKKFDIISTKLQKNEQECRTLFRLTKGFFGLKTGYKDIKRSKTKDISKEIIEEVINQYYICYIF